MRIAWNDPVRFKRVLDLGVSGVIVPYVQTADEAYAAVGAMRYPPDGVRGVAALTRTTGFGTALMDYFERTGRELLTIVQIETPGALARVGSRAAGGLRSGPESPSTVDEM